ncbi:MAG TPA: benzoate/H(+) symporter BenE family transporter [Steroidobacteraceae bacterium]|nr:benzoate/H(+) symporter BenE family transporter [Steroidobacteraceae bacterium]
MLKQLPPLHSWSSALIATVVGFGGTIALVVQAFRTLGATVEQTGSAVTALCIGIAVGGAALSLKMRIPIVLAWSTPGAALLAAAPPGLAWPTAIGVFLSAALLMIVLGLVPVLGRLAARIPISIASAMLAGVLLPFCLAAFRLGVDDALLVALLVGVFILARQRIPLYALLLVLVSAIAITLIRGDAGPLPPGALLGRLLPTMPGGEVQAIIGLAIPLFLVTLVSQNLPGLMVLRSAGYEPKPGPLIVGTGVLSLALAPFGAHAVNLAAITAALCTSEDAHPDRAKRWTVAVIYGGFYLLLAIFSPALVRLFLALPIAVIATITGLALIPALVGSMDHMLSVKDERDAAILTFLATASGLALFGLGSAFWGLVVGFVALGAKRWFART